MNGNALIIVAILTLLGNSIQITPPFLNEYIKSNPDAVKYTRNVISSYISEEYSQLYGTCLLKINDDPEKTFGCVATAAVERSIFVFTEKSGFFPPEFYDDEMSVGFIPYVFISKIENYGYGLGSKMIIIKAENKPKNVRISFQILVNEEIQDFLQIAHNMSTYLTNVIKAAKIELYQADNIMMSRNDESRKKRNHNFEGRDISQLSEIEKTLYYNEVLKKLYKQINDKKMELNTIIIKSQITSDKVDILRNKYIEMNYIKNNCLAEEKVYTRTLLTYKQYINLFDQKQIKKFSHTGTLFFCDFVKNAEDISLIIPNSKIEMNDLRYIVGKKKESALIHKAFRNKMFYIFRELDY